MPKEGSRVGRVDPEAAWRASSAAVRVLLGEDPPVTPGVLRGGRRCDRASAWRRQLAIYTAAVSLGAGTKPIVAHTGASRALVRKTLRELEDRRDAESIDQLLEILRREAERQLARARRLESLGLESLAP